MRKISLTILALGFMAFAGLAYAQDISNPVSIQGSGRSEVDFNINSGKIYHDGQLHVDAGTGGDMYLSASHRIHVTNGDLYFMRNYDSWAGSQSRIYDDGNFHFATDDYLYLDAPKLVTVQKDLFVNGEIHTPSGIISAQQLVDNTSTIQELDNDLNNYLPLAGGTMAGDINMNGNDIIGAGDLTATGTLFTTSGAIDTTGGTVLHIGEFYANSINLHKSTTISDNLTVTGGVDFSGSAYQKLPLLSSGGICTANFDRGKIYYDTDDNHIYVCQKSGESFGWTQLDNAALPN